MILNFLVDRPGNTEPIGASGKTRNSPGAILIRSAGFQPASLLFPLAGWKPTLRKLSMTVDGRESARRKPRNARIFARGSI
jgi:hypothetical protein